MLFKLANLGYRTAKRVLITFVGGTVVLLGIAMLVLPGPAVVVIPVGLAILGVEWAWARRVLRTIKETGAAALSKVGLANKEPKAADPSPSNEPAQLGGGEH